LGAQELPLPLDTRRIDQAHLRPFAAQSGPSDINPPGLAEVDV
jgi:hypothetical protein